MITIRHQPLSLSTVERESSNSTQAVTLSNTNPSDPLLVQSSPRRLSLDATTAHSNYDDNASSTAISFLFKASEPCTSRIATRTNQTEIALFQNIAKHATPCKRLEND